MADRGATLGFKKGVIVKNVADDGSGFLVNITSARVDTVTGSDDLVLALSGDNGNATNTLRLTPKDTGLLIDSLKWLLDANGYTFAVAKK